MYLSTLPVLPTYQISNWPNFRGASEGVFLSLIDFFGGCCGLKEGANDNCLWPLGAGA